MHRDPRVLSTSCYWCWLTSETTSLSCRRRCSGTGLTLQQRTPLYLRNFPATRRPWTLALGMTTPEELKQETPRPPETFIHSTSCLHITRRKAWLGPVIASEESYHWRPKALGLSSCLLFFFCFPSVLHIPPATGHDGS